MGRRRLSAARKHAAHDTEVLPVGSVLVAYSDGRAEDEVCILVVVVRREPAQAT